MVRAAGSRNEGVDGRIRRMIPVSVPPKHHADVVTLSKALAHARGDRVALVGADHRRIPITGAVLHLFRRVAEVLARGDALTIVPVGKELTTQQAARALNVSRQYVVRLLDEKRIPYTKTGTHLRLQIDDVLRYKARRDRERKATLDRLTTLSEEVGAYGEQAG